MRRVDRAAKVSRLEELELSYHKLAHMACDFREPRRHATGIAIRSTDMVANCSRTSEHSFGEATAIYDATRIICRRAFDVRLFEGDEFRRTQLLHDSIAAEALSHKWRSALLNRGWLAV